MLKFFGELRRTLPPKFRYGATGLLALMVFSALLELAALALVMPVALPAPVRGGVRPADVPAYRRGAQDFG